MIGVLSEHLEEGTGENRDMLTRIDFFVEWVWKVIMKGGSVICIVRVDSLY